MPRLLQGNIFDHVSDGGPLRRLVLVFGYIGFNEMGKHWVDFARGMPQFSEVEDPFASFEKPVQTGRSWIMFVPVRDHAPANLVAGKMVDAVAWSKTHSLNSIVTNGAGPAMPQGISNDDKRSLADTRGRWLLSLASELETTHSIQWTLTSLDDVFLRNGWVVGQL